MKIKIVEANFAEFLKQQHLLELLQKHEQNLHQSREEWNEINQQYLKYIEHDLLTKNGFIMLAQSTDSYIGLCIGCVLEDDDIAIKNDWKKYGFIHELIVLPEYQKQGIGQQLLNGAAERFRILQIPYMRISALTKNQNAISCYSKFGFKPYESSFSISLES